MRIKHIELKNFKRFTDLTISDIPEESKLVLLIGSNGSGKSSLFDAFEWLTKGIGSKHSYFDQQGMQQYYSKNGENNHQVRVTSYDGISVEKLGNGYIGNRDANMLSKFRGRSSIRIVPHITNNANVSDVELDRDAPQSFIENDTRFNNDVFLYIQQINNALREPVFRGKQADTLQIFKDSIEPLNSSLLKIFGGDENTTIQISEFQDATSSTSAKLIFKKGESKINYDLLSHGEKQVVILLINFIVRYEYYKDSIIFIDEMDCHLNTLLQYALIEEIVNRWIPDDSQLWTASHALGFIDYAKKSNTASIIDFNLLNFDLKQELIPVSKDRTDVYEIAIPKNTISSILKGYKLVVVENTNDEFYNLALGENGYLFLPANNNREVFLTIKEDVTKIGLRDRDYFRDDEIRNIQVKFPNLKILNLSTFENYIYHPDNIAELNIPEFNKDEYVNEIIKQKNERLLDVVAEIATSRTHYIEFKDCIKNDENIKPIIQSLKSDNLLDFYHYFNMKKHFNKKYLTKFQYLVSDLSRTAWFKKEVLDILNS